MKITLNGNTGTLIGTVATKPEFDHSAYNENFYRFNLAVKRLSDTVDMIPVIASNRLLKFDEIFAGTTIKAHGQIRTRNVQEGKARHLKVSFFMQDYELPCDDEEHYNRIYVDGFICKPPIYRMTPAGREIADILLAVNYRRGITAYIPCIVWGRNAKYVSRMGVGSQLFIEGRFQSREYTKWISESVQEMHIAYEVSVSMVAALVEENTEGEQNDDQKVKTARWIEQLEIG